LPLATGPRIGWWRRSGTEHPPAFAHQLSIIVSTLFEISWRPAIDIGSIFLHEESFFASNCIKSVTVRSKN